MSFTLIMASIPTLLPLAQNCVTLLSLLGLCLDGLGGLFLAYDVLGGERGPLRILSRVVIYGLIFVAGYLLLLGWPVGFWTGLGLAVLFGYEYSRAADEAPISIFTEVIFSIVRGFLVGIAAFHTAGLTFGLVFSSIASVLLLSVYIFLDTSPTRTYKLDTKQGISIVKLRSAFLRGLAVVISGLIASSMVLASPGPMFSIWLGMTVALVGSAIALVSAFVEPFLANLKEKQMGMLGTILLLIGFLLQAVQYFKELESMLRF